MTTIGPALLRLACAALSCALLALPAGNAPAQPRDAGIATPHGLLEARESIDDDECGPDGMHPCRVIALDGKVLFADRIAMLEEVLPSRDDPRLVAIGLHHGGNCCPGTDMLLDFTGPRLVVVEEFGLRDAEARPDGSYLLRRGEGENELGDQVLGLYAYRPGSGRPVLLRKIVEHPVATIGAQTYPHALLADIDLRKPLVEAVGAGQFATLRRDMAVQGPLRVLADRFLVGSGCRAHACPAAGGMFIIDQQTARAIVLHFDEERPSDGKVRYWGPLDSAGKLQRAAIAAWLRSHERGWKDVVPFAD